MPTPSTLPRSFGPEPQEIELKEIEPQKEIELKEIEQRKLKEIEP